MSFTDLARALLDAKDRSSDKAFRAQLPALLLRLSFYEDLPSDVVSRLVPLFQASCFLITLFQPYKSSIKNFL